MARTSPLLDVGQIREALGRAWRTWHAPPVPDYSPAPAPSDPELWLWRLDRIRNTLEQTRAVLEQQGWASGAWFAVRQPTGGARLATTAEALGLSDPRREVLGACLVGAMLRLAEDPDTGPSLGDVKVCVDELYEAMHEQLGHDSFPPGRSYPHHQRRAHVQGLTAWNDAPGRTRAHVLDLVDRAIARTIVASCS